MNIKERRLLAEKLSRGEPLTAEELAYKQRLIDVLNYHRRGNHKDVQSRIALPGATEMSNKMSSSNDAPSSHQDEKPDSATDTPPGADHSNSQSLHNPKQVLPPDKTAGV